MVSVVILTDLGVVFGDHQGLYVCYLLFWAAVVERRCDRVALSSGQIASIQSLYSTRYPLD